MARAQRSSCCPDRGPRGKLGRRWGAAAVRRSSLSHPGNRPLVVFSHNRCTVTYLFSLFGFALFLLECPTNINRPHRAASCGSACRLLTEAGGWWSGFAAVRCRGGMKGDEGDGKLLISRRCFVGFHLFMILLWLVSAASGV